MSDIQKYMAGQNLTPKQKKEYLLKKYVKRDNADISEIKKFALYFTPSKLTEEDILNNSRIPQPRIICVCSTLEECQKEISWRYTFHKYKDTEQAIKNDKRFETFENETKHKDSFGNEVEHQFRPLNPGEKSFMETEYGDLPITQNETDGYRDLAHYSNIVIDYAGSYYIQEIYVIQD